MTEVSIAPEFPATEPVNAVFGEPNALVVVWTGGACSDRARLVLIEANGRYEVQIREDTSLGGMLGCPAVGVPRMLKIRFSQPIAPRLVKVSQTYS